MLEIQSLKKTFFPGTVNEKKALNGVSLHLDKGDFVCLIGSNGAGKSTLLNAVSGEFFADEGRVVLDGQNMTFLPDYKRARQIGRLFQDPMRGTAPHMTIEENMALAYLRASGRCSPFSRIGRKDRDFFRSRLERLGLGLENRMSQPVGLLSGGQRQALTLLMATLVAPKLLLLDEHTAALDPATAEKVMELTKAIVKENEITCMMVTHNMESALHTGNRTVMMTGGSILLELQGEERANMTVDGLLALFRQKTGAALDNDRMLLA